MARSAAWPMDELTPTQAWDFIVAAEHDRDVGVLNRLSDRARLELAGLGSWGRSGLPLEKLAGEVQRFTSGDAEPEWDVRTIEDALRRLRIGRR